MLITTYVGYPTENARAAQRIARKGVPVFPAKGDKSPNTLHGHKDATTDPDKVTALFRRPGSELVAVPTGARSGFFVLDIDRLSAIAELPGVLPRTLTARTRRGGLHLYFRHAHGVRNSAGEVAEDVDVRGEGGFVVSPPSPGYTWVDRSSIAEAPEWLLELICKEPERKPRARRTQGGAVRAADDLLSGDTIQEGTRNQTLARICGRLHDGRDLADLEAALLEVNERRCSPALPADEVLKIARSIFRKEPCTPGRRGENRPEIDKALAQFECAMLSHPWGRWPGGLSATKVLLQLARKVGRMTAPDKLEVNLSYNEFALRAATSEKSIERYARKIKKTGLVSQNNAGRKPKEASTWVLNVPARGDGTRLQDKVIEPLGVCTDTSRTLPLTRPRLRYSERHIRRLGKSWEKCRDVLEGASGYLSFGAYAEVMGMKPDRIRDLRNPRPGGWLDRARKAGLVRVTSGGLQLLEGWEAEEDRVRQRTGETAAYTRDKERYKRERLAWLDRLNGAPGEKRSPSKEEIRARSELEVLREAGAERARYRRQMRTFRAALAREKRRQNMSYRTFHALRVISNPHTVPGVFTESYWRGELSEFDHVVGAVAEFYRDWPNWLAWREHVREAYQEWEELQTGTASLAKLGRISSRGAA